MNKIFLIIQREYFSRVKKKSFLLVTFLVPVLFMGMFTAIGYFAANQDSFSDKKKVEVVDESGWFTNKLKGGNSLTFTYTTAKVADAKKSFVKEEYDYLLYIPQSIKGAQLYGEKKPAVNTVTHIEESLTNVAQARRLADAHIDSTVLATAQQSINIDAKTISDKGETDAHVYTSYIGLLCAFLIYMALFLYGAQVMRGVIEEKVSRIIEVVISSVKPFQLMLGKIIGVGLVGLTQFVLWIVLTITLSSVAGGLFMHNAKAKMETVQKAQMAQQGPQKAVAMQTAADNGDDMSSIMQAVNSIPVAYTVSCFLFYFLFGYLLYSALFAAVGSAVDSETETQQFMLPVTLPLIFTFALSQSVIINSPDSPLAFWLSIIPFTSPIAMMIRIPFGVPAWQLALSMGLLIGGFIFTTWVAGRIYRVGILMYGKKASYKELAKWFMYKD